MENFDLHDLVALFSLLVTASVGVGFVMVNRFMVAGLKETVKDNKEDMLRLFKEHRDEVKVDAKRMNGMPERLGRIEALQEVMGAQIKEHREETVIQYAQLFDMIEKKGERLRG